MEAEKQYLNSVRSQMVVLNCLSSLAARLKGGGRSMVENLDEMKCSGEKATQGG